MSKSLGNKYRFLNVSMPIYDKMFMNQHWFWNKSIVIYANIFKKLAQIF